MYLDVVIVVGSYKQLLVRGWLFRFKVDQF